MSRRTSRSAFTVIELVISIALLAIVIVKLTIVMNEASNSQRRETASMRLEDNVRRVLDRISYAVLGADRETLFPNGQQPDENDWIEYRASLGVEDGSIVWTDPEKIALDGNQVYWAVNEGDPEERRVVWCSAVRALLESEFPNGLDDNVNGLTDEGGLSFTLQGDSLTIRLTLEQEAKDGPPLTESAETTVTCRN